MRIRSNTYEKVCHLVASNIRDKVKHNSHVVLGLATGSTPVGIYEKLSMMKNTNFGDTITFNLDEYVGLEKDHDQSYQYFMNKHLFSNLSFRKHYFPTEENYNEYDLMIKNSGGIDIQILGIGTNGHIAFNEPGSNRYSSTRIVDLTENTIKDNSRFFENIEDVPTQAYTMGMSSIMGAEKIYLISVGKHKKEILEEAVYGDVTEEIPASLLQEHPNCEVYYSE
jgi:glucosamine-6-phosphate deaminase